MLPFAEVTPAGVENFLAIVFYLAGGAASVVGLWVMLKKPSPSETQLTNQPITIRADREFATLDQHRSLSEEFSKFRDEVRVSFDDAAGTSRQSREKIYNELRHHGELIVKNNETTALTREWVEKLSDKLDRFIEIRLN